MQQKDRVCMRFGGSFLYFRSPLGLRMVEERLAARGIIVSHETVRTG
jgi:transposase-like protein